MGEISLSHCCRLCLKEGFSLTNIFSQRSAAGDPMYQIINFIYEMKIFENDGLPSQICSPCMWRMIEFDACKKNVRSAEAEIMRLLSQKRPDEPSEVEVALEHGPVKSEVSIKEEFDIVEWEMPTETVIKVPEATQHFQEADKDDYNDIESDDMEPLDLPEEEYEEKCNELVLHKPLKEEADKVPVEEFQVNCNQQVFSQPVRETPGSVDLTNILSLEASEEAAGSSFEGKSICTTQSISVEIIDTNKRIREEDLQENVIPGDESLSSEMSKSILNVRKSGWSHLKCPLSKRKSEFICDICRKSCATKQNLGTHVRVHFDERPFSCNKCDKTFKTQNVRHVHELGHLKREMNFGKSEKGSKKNQYICGICAKNFSFQSGLSKHLNVHSEKYKCNSCGKCFGNNNDLRVHLRIHTKEKPFECEVCFKYFTQKCTLNNHLLIHSSERPYVCDICDKRFKSKPEKTQHELHHLRKK